MEYTHTLQTSILAARNNAVAQWVADFLTSEGGNLGLASGLQLARREYFGPIRLSIEMVQRCCGPEAGMKYPVSQEIFERRVRRIKEAIAGQASLPPMIINFSQHTFTLNDGNHRHQALRDLGFKTIDAIIWTTGDDDMKTFMNEYSERYSVIS